MTSYKVVKKIISKKNLDSKGIPLKAHKIANKAEKRANPKAYKAINKLERKLGKNEYEGRNFKNGKVEVSKQVPIKKRPNVAIHEVVEKKEKRRMEKKK